MYYIPLLPFSSQLHKRAWGAFVFVENKSMLPRETDNHHRKVSLPNKNTELKETNYYRFPISKLVECQPEFLAMSNMHFPQWISVITYLRCLAQETMLHFCVFPAPHYKKDRHSPTVVSFFSKLKSLMPTHVTPY